MSRKIEKSDTPFSLAQSLLGDGRLTHELNIPNWTGGDAPLPIGQMAYIKGEKMGPPARQVTKS